MRRRIIRNRTNVKRVDAFSEYIAAIHRAVHALGLYVDASLGSQISQAEAVVLLHLAHRGAATINDVHKAFLHKRSTLTSVVDRLERKALVARSVGETDRRNFTLHLTADGVKTAQRVVDAVERLERAANLGAADLRSLREQLDKTAGAAALLQRSAARRPGSATL